MIDAILKNEERAVFALRSLYRKYGYLPYKMSRFEEYDLYVRNKDFLVSDQIITFSDRRGRLLALKPDVSLSIVKNAPEEAGAVQKVYYNENVYRDYREIMQAGLECVGDLSGYEIAEVVVLAAKSLALLGERSILNISHMGLISAVMADLTSELQKQAMGCLRRKNLHGLKEICADFPGVWAKLETLASCRGSAPQVFQTLAAVMTTEAERAALAELDMLWNVLESEGCGNCVRLDFSVGSDLRYYSGVVFTGYLDGIPTAVLSGGQYDRLLQKMGKKASAIGFAIYVDALVGSNDALYDVDTVILHDGADAAALMAAAREAVKTGTVLVTRKLPENRTWKNLIRLEEGEGK